MKKIELGQFVYHKDIYDGNELMEVVGIRKDSVELRGDFSGGTHNVSQTDWLAIDDVITPLEKATKKLLDVCVSGGVKTYIFPIILEELKNITIKENDNINKNYKNV